VRHRSLDATATRRAALAASGFGGRTPPQRRPDQRPAGHTISSIRRRDPVSSVSGPCPACKHAAASGTNSLQSGQHNGHGAQSRHDVSPAQRAAVEHSREATTRGKNSRPNRGSSVPRKSELRRRGARMWPSSALAGARQLGQAGPESTSVAAPCRAQRPEMATAPGGSGSAGRAGSQPPAEQGSTK